jgi:FixJ family two-component response regulator
MTMSESAYRAERARQTEILHKAVEKAMQDAADHFETPMLNAVIGALIGSLAESLAAVGDHRVRKQLRQLVDKELSRQIAALIVAGRPNSRTMIVDGRLH